jgi:lipoprotein-anchoring transpeptidase ErfK/SrfK
VPQIQPTAEASPTPQPNTDELVALAVKALVVDQVAQLMHVYEAGVEIRTLPVSTGVPPLYTPAFYGRVGHYVSSFYSHGYWADNAWYLFTASGNIYIHGAPYRVVEGTRVYQGIEFLGVQPSSRGCIRLHPADADWLTAWNPEEALIIIEPPDLGRE